MFDSRLAQFPLTRFALEVGGKILMEEAMSLLEHMAISMMLAVVTSTVKNPAHAAALQTQLLGVAGEIAGVYGYTLTPPATAPVTK
jgi:hypothetical protein